MYLLNFDEFGSFGQLTLAVRLRDFHLMDFNGHENFSLRGQCDLGGQRSCIRITQN